MKASECNVLETARVKEKMFKYDEIRRLFVLLFNFKVDELKNFGKQVNSADCNNRD